MNSPACDVKIIAMFSVQAPFFSTTITSETGVLTKIKDLSMTGVVQAGVVDARNVSQT